MGATLIVSPHGATGILARTPDVVVVKTPLDALVQLQGRAFRAVILVGSFAENPELATCLAELYPGVRIELAAIDPV
jgi:hypothetical protein